MPEYFIRFAFFSRTNEKFQVSELKRANNIVTDQELFAKATVKIPVSKLRKDLDYEHERALLRSDSPAEFIGDDISEKKYVIVLFYLKKTVF